MKVSEADITAAKKALGTDEEPAPTAPPEFEVFEDCWESVMFFLTVQTQWDFFSVGTPMGSWSARSGLKYQGVESAARLAGIARRQWPALFADLRVIELEVLRADAQAAVG